MYIYRESLLFIVVVILLCICKYIVQYLYDSGLRLTLCLHVSIDAGHMTMLPLRRSCDLLHVSPIFVNLAPEEQQDTSQVVKSGTAEKTENTEKTDAAEGELGFNKGS